MIKIHKQLLNKKEISMLMQVHDELVFEIKEKNIEEFTNVILPIMETANLPMVPLKVNLKVDVGVGNNWAEAH
jgi:DNA polymerase-1